MPGKRKKKSNKSALFWLGAAFLFLLTKLKYVFIILKFTKLSTLITLFLSLGAYAVAYGWQFAIALMYSLVFHESGHMLAAWQRGVKTSPIFFIPFIGAAVGLEEEIRHSRDESYVAYGGPLLGGMATAFALGLYLITDSDVWLLAVYLGAILNLFNLIPISPLDGGRIVTALSPKLWFAGLLVLCALLIVFPNPILILILILGAVQVISRIREPNDARLIDAYLRLLRRRRKRLRNFLQTEDIYERNVAIFEEGEYLNRLNDRIKRLKKKRGRTKSYWRIRLNLLKKQEEIFIETDLELENPEDGLKWLDGEIKKQEKKKNRLKNYYKTSPKEKAIVGAAYVLLVAVLGAMFYVSEEILPNPRHL
ncbi:hypothetical protein EWH99_04185 [Sporolactobacillus sp. THM7-7]|nr:hypothetical protein EWH99_04185 [Sporolactobacillus sp. THM7-7]